MAVFRDDLLRGVATKTEVCLELYRRERWDLFAAVYSESHCAGHQCYHLHDPRHFRHDPALARRLGDPILDVYRAIDAGLGRLLAETDGDTTVLVFASHGLGPHYDGSYLLPLLLHRLGVADASGRHGRGCCFPIVNNAVSGAIRVNLVGREPQGKVRPGPGFDAFCAELVHDLQAILNLDTGTPLVREVLYTRDLYRGEHAGHLPDLFVEWDHRYPVASLWSPRVGVIHQPWKGCRTGDHRPEGLLLARGPGVTPGRLGRVVQVMDLAPTITELLGVRLPDVDGTAVAEVAVPLMPAPQAA
jgi:predicted AlkP superfamily phosphohydrolase/phosphomutase